LQAHAEGGGTRAFGECSHAEGSGTKADTNGHAEGCYTSAYVYGHAEGYHTSATMTAAHAEGEYTIAGDGAMHVGGKYNKTSANAAFVIGNGTNSNRSDAFVVDWNGNVSAGGEKLNNVLYKPFSYSANTNTTYLNKSFYMFKPGDLNHIDRFYQVMGFVTLAYYFNSTTASLALVPWNNNSYYSPYDTQCSNIIVPGSAGTVTIPFQFTKTGGTTLPQCVAIKGNGNYSITAFQCIVQYK
jgi:hypothetical protein